MFAEQEAVVWLRGSVNCRGVGLQQQSGTPTRTLHLIRKMEKKKAFFGRDAAVQTFPRRLVCRRLDGLSHLRLLAYCTCVARSRGLLSVISMVERNLIRRTQATTRLYRGRLSIKWTDRKICPKSLEWRN